MTIQRLCQSKFNTHAMRTVQKIFGGFNDVKFGIQIVQNKPQIQGLTQKIFISQFIKTLVRPVSILEIDCTSPT